MNFAWPVRVYYEDTDAGGVVYYANYLKFMERARTEWLRALGFEQAALLRDYRIKFVVRTVALEYLQPAGLDDMLDITVEPVAVRGSLIEIAQAAQRGAETLARGKTGIVCLNTRSFKPVRIPSPIVERITTGDA
ncbi:MAG TPA: tol-pal system-associated acyl-CoA thioesterase [Burkholderiales bacterium]|nr:tol-pal system-associated acyl-CoA thioesterase [Burkholderiales bacterium]